MNGHRRWQKYTVVMAYLASMSMLAWKPGVDLISLAAFAASLSTGMAAFTYGNIQEHRAYATKPPEAKP